MLTVHPSLLPSVSRPLPSHKQMWMDGSPARGGARSPSPPKSCLKVGLPPPRPDSPPLQRAQRINTNVPNEAQLNRPSRTMIWSPKQISAGSVRTAWRQTHRSQLTETWNANAYPSSASACSQPHCPSRLPCCLPGCSEGRGERGSWGTRK